MNSTDLQNVPLIDTEQLDDLLGMVGNKKFEEIVAGFKHEIATRLDKLISRDLTFGDQAAELHALASCAGNIGMSRFSVLSRKMMNMIEEGETADLSGIAEMPALYVESSNALSEVLVNY